MYNVPTAVCTLVTLCGYASLSRIWSLFRKQDTQPSQVYYNACIQALTTIELSMTFWQAQYITVYGVLYIHVWLR